VSLLEPPEVQDKSELDIKRPRHDSEPFEWSAAETAEQVFKIFEKLTERRKLAEMEDAAERLQEMIRDYIDGRREDKRMMSGQAEIDLVDGEVKKIS
jgi:GTP cyclohydrolase I